MDKSLKDPGAEAFLKQISETKATASSPAIPPDSIPIPPSSSKPEPVKSTAKADDGGTGGGGNNGGNGGGGGKGRNSSEEEPFFTKSLLRILLLVGLAFGLLLGYMFVNKAVVDYFSSKPSQPLPQVTTKSASSSPKIVSENVPATVITDSKNVVYGSMFDCPTQEEKRLRVASADVQQLGAGNSLYLTSGCALIQLNSRVKIFEADKYQLLVAMEDIPANSYRDDAYSGKYYKCGDIGGNTESVPLCRDFLDKHRGRPVLVIIRNGGFANIN